MHINGRQRHSMERGPQKLFKFISKTNNFKDFSTGQGFPDFSGSAHVTTPTNFSAQVTTLFQKSYYTF